MTNQQYKYHLQHQRDTLREELDHAIMMHDYVEAAELSSYLQDAEDLLVYVGANS